MRAHKDATSYISSIDGVAGAGEAKRVSGQPEDSLLCRLKTCICMVLYCLCCPHSEAMKYSRVTISTVGGE